MALLSTVSRFNINTQYGQRPEFRCGAIIVNRIYLGTGTSRGVNINKPTRHSIISVYLASCALISC